MAAADGQVTDAFDAALGAVELAAEDEDAWVVPAAAPTADVLGPDLLPPHAAMSGTRGGWSA